MLNFKKDFNAKIISLVVVMVFLFNNTTYGEDLILRKPLDFQKSNLSSLKPTRYSNIYKRLRDKGDDVLERLKTEIDLMQYFESKGITIIDRRGLKKLPLDKLKSIAFIVSILPKEHLPVEIILEPDNIFNIFRSKGKVPEYGKDKGKIILYCSSINNRTIENTFLHETSHTLRKEVQQQVSFHPSPLILFLLNSLMTSLIFFYFIEGLEEALWWSKIFRFGVIIPTIVLIRCSNYLFGQDEKFARYYANYVLQGDRLRKDKTYQSMKEQVFNGIEYTYDLNGKLVILSDSAAKPAGFNAKDNDGINGRLNRGTYSYI
ncbi:MAG: hypothetical protein CO035_08070 [Candidatus Omnitrophica bacterium CG_4_9_14_0_2_um_filter_42_8]|nr:MAG: hypothetical protein COW92_03800 [Candidatus Omnitrophica bacterium CG22_combo_CG10-13_8_21_14_all_43_16]PJC46983.1 MAG: hypothetical protein CO035_08070 [Candidatus Omnitrophica bacterium CG_4_9_14_0_2_um_filter_42_8]